MYECSVSQCAILLACEEHVWIRLPNRFLKEMSLRGLDGSPKQLIADEGRRDREVVVNFHNGGELLVGY